MKEKAGREGPKLKEREKEKKRGDQRADCQSIERGFVGHVRINQDKPIAVGHLQQAVGGA